MQIASGTFKRISPATFAEKVGIPFGWIVVHHSHVLARGERRRSHARWVSLTSEATTVYRNLRYSGRLESDELVIDWAGWIDLQGRTDQENSEISIRISTVRWWETFVIPFHHIDPGYRLSAWLGAISVGLGILSLTLSIVLWLVSLPATH